MKVELDIPDTVVSRVFDGVAGSFNFDNAKVDPNETKEEFFKRVVIHLIKNAVKSFELNQFDSNASLQKKAIESDIDAKVVIG